MGTIVLTYKAFSESYRLVLVAATAFNMARGPKKHLKRLHAPKHWMLDKLGGVFAPRPSTGPHKLRECLPLMIFLRNRLKYALTYDECKKILNQRLLKVDGQVRTDKTYPAGFMDVISIEKTAENFRLIYDIKGRFTVHVFHQRKLSTSCVKCVRCLLDLKVYHTLLLMMLVPSVIQILL